MDELVQFKEAQKQGWANFLPLEAITTPAAALLVKHAGPVEGKRVLDVACGTGVVAITAARLGAEVTGIDLTPALLEKARENSKLARVDIEWREGDVEELPFEPSTFDVVLSQFGHMFAPRHDVALTEMLRVLKPGGTLAFSTWPSELLVGLGFSLASRYLPHSPVVLAPPPLWGDPHVVRERLGEGVREIRFDRGTMFAPALSPQHFRAMIEKNAGSVKRLVEDLAENDPAKLAAFRREYEQLIESYWEDNLVRQDFLMTRATKL